MITLTESTEILKPFLLQIGMCITKAVDEYNQIDSGIRSRFTKRTKSSIINDFMVFNARKELEGLEGILFSYGRGLFSVFIGNEFKLRFKKLSRHLLPSYIPTEQALKFFNQIHQVELPNMPSPVTNVVAGYRLNELQTAIQDIHITCPFGRYNQWELKVEVVESPSIELPTAENEEGFGDGLKGVTPKSTT